MRRRWDSFLITCAALGLLSAIVVGVFVVPTVLGTSAEQKQLAHTQKELARQAQRADRLARKIAREGEKRRDQTCRIDERDHLGAVKRLRRTYGFLADLPRSEYGTNLTVAIVRQLPEVEREARQDVAPPFCDAPGVGLPEPDPELPRRRRFDHLLGR